MDSKRYNIAVIGAGDMGTRHINGWIEAGHHVLYVVDIDLEKAGRVAKAFNIPNLSEDYEIAISDSRVDIVSVCLPLKFHKPVTVYAANKGKHVFCEKPLCSSLEEAKEMEKAIRQAGVKFGLGFQRNLSPGIKAVREWVNEDKFGHPLVISSDLLQEVRPKRVMHDKNGNQGPVVDTACHFFLMWQTILQSKPKKIYASGGILAKDRPEIAHFEQLAVDTAVITMEYESGDIATMSISWGLARDFKMPSKHDRIFGPKGGAQGAFNTFTTSEIEIELFVGSEYEIVKIEQSNLFMEQFKLFVNSIDHNLPEHTSFETGIEMLKLSYAVLESIETGKIIEL